jgi:hypothetical protein
MLPANGSVLGIDVGFSRNRRSSAVCGLDWDIREIRWTVRRFRAEEQEREVVIAAVAGHAHLEAVALDGPLRSGFDVIRRYRTAERMLTLRLAAKIGKPGQASAPVGIRLNAAANACAQVVLKRCRLGRATHLVRIDPLAVVEAFPSSFLGVMIEDPAAVPVSRSNRSDTYYKHLVTTGALARLLNRVLPGRLSAERFEGVTNHDDRAAIVCALTALCVAAGDYTAVGDGDGWIILPPLNCLAEWALNDLNANGSQTGHFVVSPDRLTPPLSQEGARSTVGGEPRDDGLRSY